MAGIAWFFGLVTKFTELLNELANSIQAVQPFLKLFC